MSIEPARELLLLRHGKSDWSADYQDDFDRPLAARGRKAIKRVARRASELGWSIERAVSSPALRARQSAERFCRQVGLPRERIRWEPRIYEAGLDELLAVLAELAAEPGPLVLVGHNPGFEELLEHLCAEPPPRSASGKLLPTAALARLALPAGPPAAGTARLLGLLRPREL